MRYIGDYHKKFPSLTVMNEKEKVIKECKIENTKVSLTEVSRWINSIYKKYLRLNLFITQK